MNLPPDTQLRVILPEDLPPGAVVQVELSDDCYDGITEDEMIDEFKQLFPDHVKCIITSSVTIRVIRPTETRI